MWEQPDLTMDQAHDILKKCRSELEQRFLIRNGKWLYKVITPHFVLLLLLLALEHCVMNMLDLVFLTHNVHCYLLSVSCRSWTQMECACWSSRRFTWRM